MTPEKRENLVTQEPPETCMLGMSREEGKYLGRKECPLRGPVITHSAGNLWECRQMHADKGKMAKKKFLGDNTGAVPGQPATHAH